MLGVACTDTYGNTITRLTQWDVNQSLVIENTELSYAPEFHFCNKNSVEALVVASSIDDNGTITVKIPNSLLREPYTITAYMYAYSSDTSAKVLAIIKIPIIQRVKPSEYTYVENIDVLSAAKIEQTVSDKLKELEDGYTEAINQLSLELDGSPKGVFSSVDELENENPGIYLNKDDGYIYYWDGNALSDKILQYLSTVKDLMTRDEIKEMARLIFIEGNDGKEYAGKLRVLNGKPIFEYDEFTN